MGRVSSGLEVQNCYRRCCKPMLLKGDTHTLLHYGGYNMELPCHLFHSAVVLPSPSSFLDENCRSRPGDCRQVAGWNRKSTPLPYALDFLSENFTLQESYRSTVCSQHTPLPL